MQNWNLATIIENIGDVVPDRAAIVGAGSSLTYAQLDERANRVADALSTCGVGPGDRVGLVVGNRPAYLEAMLGAFKIRALPVNINLRYTVQELTSLFADTQPSVILHETEMAEQVVAAAAATGDRPVLWSIDAYEDIVGRADPQRPDVDRSGDDHYLLYTGGTTGLPKGVLWRHEDLLFAALGGGNAGGEPVSDPSEIPVLARSGRTRCLPASPFTHGTAHWMALTTLLGGGTVIVDTGPGFDADRTWDLAERQQASHLVIVGDAFARPLADALHDHPDRWDLTELLIISSGGAILSATSRRILLDLLPWAVLVDGYGTSETGGQGQMPYWSGQGGVDLPRFHVDEHTAVLDDGGRPAPPGSGIVGRLARRGHLPLGYHDDPEASARIFVDLQGERWAVPGDLARVEADGSVTLLGRGSSSINTGGEKVYPAEVEIIIKAHPEILDAVVVGTPEPRFGEQVAAVVVVRNHDRFDTENLLVHCRQHLASFKVPRNVVVVHQLERRPSGKTDLAWARELLATEPA